MWIRQCASNHKSCYLWPVAGSALPDFCKLVLVWLAFYVFLIHPSLSFAADNIVVAVTLNQEREGDFFVILREDGDFLVRTIDLSAMGLIRIPGEPFIAEGEEYLSLRSTDQLTFDFDEQTLTLQIMADPDLFGTKTLDMSPSERVGVYYPNDNSLFLNYGVDYVTSSDDFTNENLTLTNELGIRYKDVLFQTDSSYRDDDVDSNFVRLNSRFVFDDRKTLKRYVAGDLYASSGTLGSLVNLGGFSLSKVYDINPYLIYYPMFGFNAQLPLPSEVDVYLGGTKLRSERFAPGDFSIENLYGFYGEETVKVVIRDAFGRERSIQQPYYFTDLLLRKGLQEYSYNLGWIRDDFGQTSNSYSDLAASIIHRYGATDSINLGWRGEAKHDLANLGAESIFKVGHLGVMRLEASFSNYQGNSGIAGLASYEYLSRRFRMQLGMQGFSEDYRTLRDSTAEDPKIRKLAIQAGMGYTTTQLGSLNIDYARTDYHEQQDRDVLSFNWSRRIFNHAYVNTTLRRIWEETDSNEALLTLTYYFGQDYSMSTNYRHLEDEDVASVEMRKLLPVGEGTGWELRAERTDGDPFDETLLSADFEQNARYAKLRGTVSQVRQDSDTDEQLRLGLSGALVHLAGTTTLTRPVTDSFGLVRVAQLEDVQVNLNGQAISRTDEKGQAILPEMSSYYENRVSFEDKDLPIEYIMPQVQLKVAPPLRSGSCIFFPVKKYQAFTGFLLVQTKEGPAPLANALVQLEGVGPPLTFWTASNGEFYLDGSQDQVDIMAFQGCTRLHDESATAIKPGTYPLTIKSDRGTFNAMITLPDSPETYVTMGDVTLEPISTLPEQNKSDSGQPNAPMTEVTDPLMQH